MKPLSKAQQELYDWLVNYISANQHAPSIRQMMQAMKLRSVAPIQSRLEHLRDKGYIDWNHGQARTIRILHPPESQGIPILGAIAAGGLVEPFTDVEEELDLANLFSSSNCFALRVVGDSMIEDLIADGDLVIMRSVSPDGSVPEGEIVAARVEGQGTTLKRFYHQQETVILQASNPKYPPLKVRDNQVEIQGILVGVWRNYS